MQYFCKHFDMKTDISGAAVGLGDFAGRHLLRGSIWSRKMISLHLLFHSLTLSHKPVFLSSICCCENYFDVKHRIIILLESFSSLEYFNAGYKKEPSP